MKVFASFLLYQLPDGGIAATTRPADRGESGRIGLPGGKVEKGETALIAALREAKEEGWDLRVSDSSPIHSQLVDGKLVQWFAAIDGRMLRNYKEMDRILPVIASPSQIKLSGYGNENLKI